MWSSDKRPAKPRKSILPPSDRQLFWAKQDRLVTRTQFHQLESKWTSKTRSKAIEAEVPAATVADATAPSWLQYRTKPRQPMYFRTKPVTKGPAPKKPL